MYSYTNGLLVLMVHSLVFCRGKVSSNPTKQHLVAPLNVLRDV